jgi:hypothetical protein
MLAADKLYLASSFQRNAVELKEKELKLHYDNFMAISTQVGPALPLHKVHSFCGPK